MFFICPLEEITDFCFLYITTDIKRGSTI